MRPGMYEPRSRDSPSKTMCTTGFLNPGGQENALSEQASRLQNNAIIAILLVFFQTYKNEPAIPCAEFFLRCLTRNLVLPFVNTVPVFWTRVARGQPVGAGVPAARNRPARRAVATSLREDVRVNPTPYLRNDPLSNRLKSSTYEVEGQGRPCLLSGPRRNRW